MPLLYILLLLLPPAVFVGGSYYVRHRDQAAKDAQRSTYELTFPAKTDAEQAAKWLKVISGTRRSWFDRFLGTPTIAFEMWATSRGIRHRVRLTHAGHVIPQLQAKIPGIRVERVREEDALDWTEVRELGEQVPTRTLYIKDAEELAESLLTAMQPLQHDETLLLQWVLSPAPRSKPPAEADVIFSDRFHLRHLASGNRARKDEVADRRQKMAEPNYNGVLRIAAKAPHPLAAAGLLNRITEVLASTDNYPNRFVRLKTFKGDRMSERIRLASGSVAARPPVTVSVAELTGLLGWPIGSPNVPGLPQGRARQLPANDAIPRVGNVLARSNFSGDERPIALAPKHALQHVHVMGPTGSGKSVAMANQALQDIDQGHGVIIIDPKPDNLSDNTFQMVLDRIPAHRVDDVVILDIRDQDYPAGFNLLQGNPESVANDLQRLMDSVFPVNAGGMMLQESIYHSVLTLMTSAAASSPMTISEILPLCVPRAADVTFADQLTRGLKDEQLLHYWQDIDQGHVKDRARNFEPLKRRIWQLDRPKLRNIFGQSQSTIDLRDVLSKQKILLINLAGEDEKVLELFGALLMMGIWSAVQSGACSPIRPVFMYIDEVQKLLHMPVSLAEMMQEARSQGLGLRLAHQHLAQLNARRDLLPNIMANARTRMVFQMQHDDAQVMARAFGTEIGVNDLTNLGQYEVMLKVMTEKGVSRAVTGTTADVGKKTGYAERIRAESRRKYGRPRAEVEAEIKARRQAVGGDSAAELGDRAPAWAKKGRRASESDAS